MELICTSEFFKKLKLHEPLWRVQFRFLKNSRVQINSPLWKRVIAWERSRAASGYGIIWGDADRNLVRNVIAWIGFNRATDGNKIEVIVLDDQKSRELRRMRPTGLAVYLDDCTIL